MARIPVVTRTVKYTTVHALCFNIEAGVPFDADLKIPRTYKTEKDILKYLTKNYKFDENVKLVHVKSWDVEEELRKMTEEDFIRYSEVVEKR